MRINPILYGFLVLTIFLGTILAFQAAGIWSVSGKLTSGGEAVQPSDADVNTIKGWMTLDQVTTTYDVSLADLLAQFGLPADTPPETAIKDLESDLFSVTSLRDWLTNRSETSAPILPDDPTLAPVVPLEQVESTPTPLPETTAPQAPTPAVTEHIAPDKTITGKTTFQELLDWGVSSETIQSVIGGQLPPLSTTVKDYVTSQGLEFSSTKTNLQAEIDLIK